MGICAGKPATKTSTDPNSQVEALENGYKDPPTVEPSERLEEIAATPEPAEPVPQSIPEPERESIPEPEPEVEEPSAPIMEEEPEGEPDPEPEPEAPSSEEPEIEAAAGGPDYYY